MEFIFSLLNISSTDELIILILKIALFFAVLNLCYHTCRYIIDHNTLKRLYSNIYKQMSESEKNRLSMSEKDKIRYGETDKKDLMHKMDKLIEYSGLKNKFSFLSTEIILFTYITVFAVSIIVSYIATKNVIYGIIFDILFLITTIGTLIYLDNKQYKDIKKQAIKFINIIQNFASTSNDIISILERTAGYMDDPLQSLLIRCVAEARNSGDREHALSKLQDSIQNEYFKELIRALRIGANYEANYFEIIEDSRSAVQQSLKFEEEKESIRNTGRFEMISLLVVGALCIYLGVDAAGSAITDLFFGSGLVGNILAGYTAAVIIIVIYLGFIKGVSK